MKKIGLLAFEYPELFTRMVYLNQYFESKKVKEQY
jgi:hypothetical protein